MSIEQLWESDFDFRKTAITYFEKFVKEMQDIKQRHDAWGGFKYKGWWYDLHLFDDEDGIRDCFYAVKINCNGDLETDFDDEFVIPETEPFECDRCDNYEYYEIDELKFCDGKFFVCPETDQVFCEECEQ